MTTTLITPWAQTLIFSHKGILHVVKSVGVWEAFIGVGFSTLHLM